LKKLVIVMGPRRSGTSYAASVLYHLGFYLGEELLKADEMNPRGYFEDVELHNLLMPLDKKFYEKKSCYEEDRRIEIRGYFSDYLLGCSERAGENLVAVKEPSLAVHLRLSDMDGIKEAWGTEPKFLLTRRNSYNAAMSHMVHRNFGHAVLEGEARRYQESIKWAEEFPHMYLDFGVEHAGKIARFVGRDITEAAIDAFDQRLVDTWKDR